MKPSWRQAGRVLAAKLQAMNPAAGKDDCLIWRGSPSTSGYGRITVDGKTYQTHRLAYQWGHWRSKIPKGMYVTHWCNNKLCCRHLVLATPKANARMASEDGLLRTGEQHPRSKLTVRAVVDIILQAWRGVAVPLLAQTYGVCRGAIYNILAGRTWKRVVARVREELSGRGIAAR